MQTYPDLYPTQQREPYIFDIPHYFKVTFSPQDYSNGTAIRVDESSQVKVRQKLGGIIAGEVFDWSLAQSKSQKAQYAAKSKTLCHPRQKRLLHDINIVMVLIHIFEYLYICRTMPCCMISCLQFHTLTHNQIIA